MRVVWLIIDSVGVGGLLDSEKFGDINVNTLGNIVKNFPDIKIPNLRKLGIGNIDETDFFEKENNPIGCFGKCDEVSNGKDTTTGHWEMTGVLVNTPFNTFEEFPKEIIEEFEKRTGRKVVANKPSSGTEILDEYGEHQMKTGDVIVYTSADSVFQIAAHEEIIPLEELYKMCEIAREILMGDNAVARVIARPYIGEGVGKFTRTSNRRDYSLDPFEDTVLDNIKNGGLDVIAVGKIEDIFNGQGITEAIHTKSNMHGMEETINYINKENNGLIFTNLVDFDSMYGHRRDVLGYKNALEEFDIKLEELMNSLKEDDVLIINADHGNDPTYKGSDHTREYVPVLVYGKKVNQGVNLGIRKSFSDIGATVTDILNIKMPQNGISFKNEILN
ncbi:MAG: phosphopentomutase [Peptostreptococcaceae bacterium]